ncbi:MAG: carbohydrate kinase [Gammaproteobacteria bacterium]|nr:carbohydrate kinase [Gammaproteobacteria bacterium]
MSIHVAVFGESLYDMIQQDNGDFRPYIGGSPYNVARSFARQGLDCTYLSPIAIDHLGDSIYQSVLDEGIHFATDNRSPRTTSLALVYKDEQGKPDYRLYRKGVADLDISAERLMQLVPIELELFHTGSLALVPEMLDVLIPVIVKLKKQGVKISIDVNVRKGVKVNHEQYVAAIWQFIEFADIVKVSDEDLILKGLTGKPEYHVKAMLKRMQQGIVVLTFGEGGSHLYTDSMHIEQPVHEVGWMGDTVGAGDTFFSAMLAQLLRDKLLSTDADMDKLAYALKFGSCAAAMNVEQVGCQPPSYQDVTNRLKEI